MSQFPFKLNPTLRKPFDMKHISNVPREPGVYVVYDMIGPLYAGRSGRDIQRRLRNHRVGAGNKNLALAKRVGACPSLTFTYCCLPKYVQPDVERLLIASLGVADRANLRREGLYEENLKKEEDA